jgi:hypothetical protein
LRYDLSRGSAYNTHNLGSSGSESSLTFELSDVPAARSRLSRSFRSTGVLMSSRNSTAFVAAFWNDWAIVVG